MNKYLFFDSIETPKCTFGSVVDDYFFLDAVSGKLGHRKFHHASPEKISIANQEVKKSSFWRTLLNVVKVFSYLTVILPLIFLICKAVYRKKHTFKIFEHTISPLPASVCLQVPPTLNDDLIKAKQLIAKMWERFEFKVSDSEVCDYTRAFVSLNDTSLPSYQSFVYPESGLCNLVKQFKHHTETQFIPFCIKKEECNPQVPKEFEYFQEQLAAAFLTGATFVAARLADGVHVNAAVFQKDGEFRIIDSMSENTVDLEQLTQKLNAAKIKDASGKVIQFHGEYVNTNLQKGGNECKRFATLYAYHCLKQRNLEAYQEVNGAFLEGRLKSFEDHSKIDGSKKVKRVDSFPDYKFFMNSWMYRFLGIKKDDWKEILASDLTPASRKGNISAYILRKNQLPSLIFSSATTLEETFLVSDANGNKIALQNIDDVDKVFASSTVNPNMTLGGIRETLHVPGSEMVSLIFVQNTATGQKCVVKNITLEAAKKIQLRFPGPNKVVTDQFLEVANPILNR